MVYRIVKVIRVMAICLVSTLFSTVVFANTPKIAIIIDDVGHRYQDTQLHSLPTEVTFSILPDTDFAPLVARQANQNGREVMIHMPMESLVPSQDLGNEPLLVSMSQAQLNAALQRALSNVPHAIGINNHMGSKFTQLKSTMDAFFASLAQTDLFFVDSRTTPFTRAYQQALEHDIPAVERHVFLDHVYQQDFMEAQFVRLMDTAQINGFALAIGHPNKKTLAFLHANLSRLAERGITLVPISQYIDMQQPTRLAKN
jgi:polysaccharide deacetylase 2 family uncharacterized protein YibQ